MPGSFEALRRAASALAVAVSLVQAGATDIQLPTLKVGSEVYSNVTVTTVTGTSILFNHSRGMGSAKLKDLDPQLQQSFHFDPAKAREAERRQRGADAGELRPATLPRSSINGAAVDGVPFPAMQVISPDTQVRLKIRKDAAALLQRRKFEKLDDLARGYRRSREVFPDGTWLLGEVYNGLLPVETESDEQWEARLNSLEGWTRARPESITARVALANTWVAYGWKARGPGSIEKVTRAAFRIFATRAQRGILVIEDSAKLKEWCPYAPLPVLYAARGIGARQEQFYQPLFQALAAEPNFIPYYEQAVIFQLPRWFGLSDDEAESFLRQAADKLGGQEGDVLYARIAWRMQCSGLFADPMKECHFSAAKVEQGFLALERRYPDALSVRNAHACLGSFTGDQVAARGLIDKLRGKVDVSVWRSADLFKEHVRLAYAAKEEGNRR